jgi:hypothetical protein
LNFSKKCENFLSRFLSTIRPNNNYFDMTFQGN